nr:MAG TPA_asm: hypothetical protein [Caudoviricetes sp.]
MPRVEVSLWIVCASWYSFNFALASFWDLP